MKPSKLLLTSIIICFSVWGNVPNVEASCGAFPAQGYAQSRIADPNKNCASGTPNNPACASGSDGCSLYEKSSVPHVGTPPFYTTMNPPDNHLTIPVKPCRGVEDVQKGVSDCGGEGIWDSAWSQVGSKSTDGLAVNPTNHRTQHQLHIHIAKVQQSLQQALAAVANKKTSPPTFYSIKCGGSGGTNAALATNCQADLKQPAAAGDNGIKAAWVQASKPSDAKPFKYESDTKCGTILVSQPVANGGFVVVHALDRPAECLLHCGDCESRCNQHTTGKYCA